jgi:hypothetical protein
MYKLNIGGSFLVNPDGIRTKPGWLKNLDGKPGCFKKNKFGSLDTTPQKTFLLSIITWNVTC